MCLGTARIHDCNHGRFGFLTRYFAAGLSCCQVYSLKWFMLVSNQCQCQSEGQGGAVVLGMRVGGTSATTVSLLNFPFIFFSVHSHSVGIMPACLGRDIPSVYVETKLSAMCKSRGNIYKKRSKQLFPKSAIASVLLKSYC